MAKIVFTYWKNLFIKAAKEMGKELGFWGLIFGLILSGVYAVYIGEQTFDLGGILVFSKVFLVLLITAWIVFVFIFAAKKDKNKQDEINTFTELKNSKPIIKLIDFGFEVKNWNDGKHTVNAYLNLSNQAKDGSLNDVNSKRVFPTITWTNEQGTEIDKNHGRWAIPNEDRPQMKILDMGSVDLDANGEPRRLYFTYGDNQSRTLNSWCRTWDGYNKSRLIVESPAYVIIDLKDNRTSTARFRFRIEHSSDGLEISRINNKNQVMSYQEFRYSQLLKYEKKEENNGKKTTKGIKKGSPHERGFPKGTKKGN